jgi:RimJ/RimL family protein N-acetyltransferase
MTLLRLGQCDKLTPLIPPHDYHLILRSIVQDNTSATIYVDRLFQPQAAFLWKKENAWLLGSPIDSFIDGLLDILEDRYFQILRERGADYFRLHWDERWGSALNRVFIGLKREKYPRSYYHLGASGKKMDVNPPHGFRIVEIDEAFLASNYTNLDQVRDETVSERDSIEDFLENSFGYAAMKGDEIVSWCMSEYNTGNRCELGIETVERYQRKGLATQVSRAVIGHAVGHGVYDIGWHCWKNNEPSVRTALRIGFKHVLDYPISEVKVDDY